MLYDKDIREPLFEYFEGQYDKLRIIEEMQMGKSIADAIMVLPNKLVGIEIKSDADTYARLSGQVKDYDRFCDLNYVVVGSSHVRSVQKHVPEWWGILSAKETESGAELELIREAKDNPKVKPGARIYLLWRPELVHIQQLNKLPKYAEKSKRFVQKKILEKVPMPLLQSQVSEVLFERDYTTIAEIIRKYKKGKQK